MAAPVSPDPRDTAPPLDGTAAREIRDPRSETGVSTRRLRHLIGRGLDVLMLLAIDVFGITAAIFSGLVLREVLGSRPVYEDQLWAAERAWLPFVLLVSVLIFTRNGLYRPRETRPGGAQIVAAHQAGSMPWVILTAEREQAAATGPHAPRCGLFVLRPAKQ